jgi:hypothetical protein
MNAANNGVHSNQPEETSKFDVNVFLVGLTSFVMSLIVVKALLIVENRPLWEWACIVALFFAVFAGVTMFLWFASDWRPAIALQKFTMSFLVIATCLFTINFNSPDWGNGFWWQVGATGLLALWAGNFFGYLATRKC